MQHDPRVFLEAAAAKGLRWSVESDSNAVAAIQAAAFQNDPIMFWTSRRSAAGLVYGGRSQMTLNCH